MPYKLYGYNRMKISFKLLSHIYLNYLFNHYAVWKVKILDF